MTDIEKMKVIAWDSLTKWCYDASEEIGERLNAQAICFLYSFCGMNDLIVELKQTKESDDR